MSSWDPGSGRHFVWLSVNEAARLLRVTHRMPYRFIDEEPLPASRFGRVIRLLRPEVEELIDTRRIAPGELGVSES